MKIIEHRQKPVNRRD